MINHPARIEVVGKFWGRTWRSRTVLYESQAWALSQSLYVACGCSSASQKNLVIGGRGRRRMKLALQMHLSLRLLSSVRSLVLHLQGKILTHCTKRNTGLLILVTHTCTHPNTHTNTHTHTHRHTHTHTHTQNDMCCATFIAWVWFVLNVFYFWFCSRLWTAIGVLLNASPTILTVYWKPSFQEGQGSACVRVCSSLWLWLSIWSRVCVWD